MAATSQNGILVEPEEPKKSGILAGYQSFLLKIKGRPLKVRVPSNIASESETVTDVPRITDPNIDEVETNPVYPPYSFV
ncbi:MAG TPA: hypothetical protein VMS79_02245, partial [Methanomassiliicoccales archaeon]|nr:hypothetical protein [Methanomassiliicoccales archaeon]